MADWSNLLRDLLELIAERLIECCDHYRFSSVCASWRAAALVIRLRCSPSHLPGLMIPADNGNRKCLTRRFLPFPKTKSDVDYQQLPVLAVPQESLCRGSYQDWLVMVDTDMAMYLLNPFSETRINLPPVTDLPKPHHGNFLGKWYVEKVIVSASPSSSSDCTVLVFYGLDEVAFCNLGDQKWRSPVAHSLERKDTYNHIDGIFHKGQFYIVKCCGDICTLDTSSAQPRMTRFVPLPKVSRYVEKWYLVESRGHLLQILRKVENIEDDDNQIDQEENIEDGEEEEEVKIVELDGIAYFDFDNQKRTGKTFQYKTTSFEVNKLDESGLNPEWVEVKHLDGDTLFVGFNQAFSLTESQIKMLGFKGNSIYFSDDNVPGQKLHLLSGHDIGIFNLEDSTVQPLYQADFESTQPPAIWVSQPFGT